MIFLTGVKIINGNIDGRKTFGNTGFESMRGQKRIETFK